MKHLLILALLATTVLFGCGDDSSDIMATENPVTIDKEIDLDALRVNLATQELQDLNEDEIAGLVLMREEEKLARDVYLTMADLYDLRIFSNIAGSEQIHTDAVLLLLDRYGITDPVGDNPIGVFQNEDLQNLFDDLIAQGSQSLENALYVGCSIEEIDILDLQELMAATDFQDLLLVYGHLLNGSGNHLRAYVRNWEQQSGQEYEPQFMSAENFAAVISAGGTGGGEGHGQGHGSHGQGHGNGGNGNGNGNGGNGGNGHGGNGNGGGNRN